MASNIREADYEVLCILAREFNEYLPPERVRAGAPGSDAAKGGRPGDEFNRKAQWPEILTAHGWAIAHTAGAVTYWRRPGKSRGVSATTGKCKTDGGGDLLYVFTSNASPFEQDTAYSKFAALAMLEHHGDFAAAAGWLAKQGYGRPSPVDPVVVFPATPKSSGNYKRGFKWASELFAPPKADDWVWEGYLPRAGITLLSALWKAGKTTLLSHLLKACGTGGAFLGKPLKAARVLYVSEEGERHWVRRRDALGLGDNTGFYLQPFPTKPVQANWLGFISQVVQDVREYGFDLVVFDTLAKMWPVQEENDAGSVDAALMPLWELTKAGASVLLIHHLRKSGGQEYTGSRGSGALSAFPDIIVELTRFDASDAKDRKRVLRAKGRYEETPDELVIELVEGEYVALPDTAAPSSEPIPTIGRRRGEAERQSDEEAKLVTVMTKCPKVWMQAEEIREALRGAGWGMRNEDANTHLASLLYRGQVVVRGVLRSKKTPREYALVSRLESDSAPGSQAGMTSGNETIADAGSSFPSSGSSDTHARNESTRNETGEPADGASDAA